MSSSPTLQRRNSQGHHRKISNDFTRSLYQLGIMRCLYIIKLTIIRHMNHQASINSANNILETLLKEVQAEVKQKQLVKNIPNFLIANISSLINESLMGTAITADLRQLSCQDQEVASIPKLEKDNLMPKDLSEQKVRVNSPNRQSPASSRSSIKKRGNLSPRLSSKLQEKLKSISFAEQGSKKLQSKQLDQTLNKLELQNGEEDEEVDHMRQKTEVRLKNLEEEKKFRQDRQKYYQSRLKQYHQVAEGHENEIAFDYGGDALRKTMYDGKVRLNSVKTGMGSTSKKLKQGFSKLNAPEFSRIESASKRPKDKEDNFRTIKQLEMPLFPSKHPQPYNPKNLKLEEYRKFYGSKYSRMGVNTIQVVERAKTSRQDLFKEKKHLKEQNNGPMTQTRFRDHEVNTRRLALPKLHGKYKVLDRYEE